MAGVAVSPCGRSITLEQRVFSLSIERCRGLVQHQEQRAVAHESTRESEFLPLAERDLDTSGPRRAQLRLQSRGQPRDDVPSAGAFDGRSYCGLVA